MSKHTPGTWVVSDDKCAVESDDSIGGNIICLAPESWPSSMAYWRANARLIALVPQLLEACIAVNKCGNAGAKLLRAASDKVRAVLREAEGLDEVEEQARAQRATPTKDTTNA